MRNGALQILVWGFSSLPSLRRVSTSSTPGFYCVFRGGFVGIEYSTWIVRRSTGQIRNVGSHVLVQLTFSFFSLGFVQSSVSRHLRSFPIR